MKKLIISIILFLLIIPLISTAGKIYTIDFPRDITQQTLTIAENDRVDFDLIEGSHTIIIDNIKENQVELDIFLYINLKPEERYPVGYVTLHPNEYIALDMNKDKYNDLEIKTLNFKENEVTLLFTKTHKCIFTNPKDCEKENPIEENGFIKKLINKIPFIKDIDKTGIIITLSILIIGSILYLFFRKPKS